MVELCFMKKERPTKIQIHFLRKGHILFCKKRQKKPTADVQYWKCAVRRCPGRGHTTGNDEVQLFKSTDHDHGPDMEAALSAKMKSDLCERAADNPTLPMKEVYNQYMSSDVLPLKDDL